MKFTECSILEFKGKYNEQTPGEVQYHYFVIKLGENLYYKNHNARAIETTSDIGFAAHIHPDHIQITFDEVNNFIQRCDGN